MKEIGVRLQFDAVSQKLRKIRYTPMGVPESTLNNSIEVIYNGGKLFSPGHAPTCESVSEDFPPTTLGAFKQSDRTYCMSFKDGLNFEFKIKDSETFNAFKEKKEHPIRIGNYSPQAVSAEVVPPHGVPTPVDEVPRFEVWPHEGVQLIKPNSDEPSWILLGSGIQDVLSVLGTPDITGDEFLNFFDYGIDVKLDKDNACLVKKIIIHTNIPGCPNFGRFKRAGFEIFTDRGDKKNRIRALSQDCNNETTLHELIERWGDPGQPIVAINPNFSNVQYFYHFGRGLNVEVNASGIISSLEVCSRCLHDSGNLQ